MTARVACLSPFTEDMVRQMFKGEHAVDVVLVPEAPAQEAVLNATHDAHLVIADKRHKHRLDRRVLENMRNCQLIQQAAVGFDSVDHRAAAEYGIPVANAAGYNRDAVADWTLMAILNLIRMGSWGDRQMRKTGWWGRDEMMGNELGALTVGLVGLGNVGGAVARRLAGFGPRILFSDPDPARSFAGAERRELATLLSDSDIVCLHAPLDIETRGLINRDSLASMRSGAFLVNAARGPLVDEIALVEALTSGRLRGAALDVYESEPLAADSPLRSLESVFLSPHIGGGTIEAEARLLEVVGENLLRVLNSEPPVNIVNDVVVRSNR